MVFEKSVYTNENTSEDIFESVKKDSTEMILSFMMKENVKSEDEQNSILLLGTVGILLIIKDGCQAR